jgi:hypothetical protein
MMRDDTGKHLKELVSFTMIPAVTPRALDKAALSYRHAGKTDEADRLSRELRERYPDFSRLG